VRLVFLSSIVATSSGFAQNIPVTKSLDHSTDFIFDQLSHSQQQQLIQQSNAIKTKILRISQKERSEVAHRIQHIDFSINESIDTKSTLP
jgi:hypothetical protein